MADMTIDRSPWGPHRGTSTVIRRPATIFTVILGIVLSAFLLAAGTGTSQAGKASGKVFVVQAVPDKTVTISVDGRELKGAVEVGDVVGPLSLREGEHDLVLTSDEWSVTTTVQVRAGKVHDLVLHSPASRQGDPVVSTYTVPTKPIGPRKARVVLAHTATAPPADVRVDQQTVFTNIANGEYAEADVSAGSHKVALLPSGSTRGAFLGPLDVTLQNKTVTMVYAVGSPKDNSMRVVSHSAALASNGALRPSVIDTGSEAGLARRVAVSLFDAR